MTGTGASDDEIRGARLVVSGRVQGVGFRYFVVQAAEGFGVSGTVRNLPNGDVEVVAEGAAHALDRLEEVVRAGPRSARVERVAREDVAPAGRHAGFHVVR
jgi:acylphosphatase